MSLEVKINLNSLRLIQADLDEAISNSAADFEAFVVNQSDLSLIQGSLEGMAQVGGVFRFLEFSGAALLADEMAALIREIADPEIKTSVSMINALTHGYFVLPRYIEYIRAQQFELPIMIIPYVNELRISRKETLLPEWHFYPFEVVSDTSLPTTEKNPDIRLLLASMPRLRHMFQTGLVGVIKNPSSSAHYLFMSRAVHRITTLFGNHPQGEIWQLADAVLMAFSANALEMTLNRKRSLAAFEKLMRQIVDKGEEAINQAPPYSLKADLLFLLSLANYSDDKVTSIRNHYALTCFDKGDNFIAEQRALMHGPSFETIESVIKILSGELRNAKDVLELASQNNVIEGEERDLLHETITRVADTLSILNLQGPKDILTEQLHKIDSWPSDGGSIQASDFLIVADAVLYVESALSSLDRHELTVADLNKATEVSRKKILASSQFAMAEQLVIQEAQAGIGLAKRAITSYVDSNFDVAHISNVNITLNTIWGGLYILKYQRAANILKSCISFIDGHIKQSKPGDQSSQLIETLADALISFEYYLNELATSRTVDESILDIAEQSLQALGFSVEPVH